MRRDDMVDARTSAWTAAERVQLDEVVVGLLPSARHLADIFDWMDDIAARDGARPAAVLATPTLRAALAAHGSAPDRLKRWKESLRRLRYPRLVAREQAFREAASALDLGRGVAIAPPAGLEGGIVSVTIRAASVAELEAALDRFERCRRVGDLTRLFDILA
jgi:hypothetical protein